MSLCIFQAISANILTTYNYSDAVSGLTQHVWSCRDSRVCRKMLLKKTALNSYVPFQVAMYWGLPIFWTTFKCHINLVGEKKNSIP